MENNIPTAKEFFKELYGVNDRISTSNAVLLAKEFTKLHCEAQLKAILEKSDRWRDLSEGEYKRVDMKSIINAYPLDLIK
jgi:hypothetical protein